MAPSCGWTTLMASSASANCALEMPEEWKENQNEANPVGISDTVECEPMTHPEDPYLHLIPSTLSAIYIPLPILLRVMISFLTACFVSSRSMLVKTMMDIVHTSSFLGFVGLPFRILRWAILNFSWARKELLLEFLKMLIHSIAMYTVATVLLQDFLPRYHPSRVTTEDLISKFGTLPSPLSNYALVLPELNYRVHYLKLESDDDSREKVIDLIHLNHGFGASSLSWLPVVPRLANKFNTTILGHDAPGFGLTDRLLGNVSFYSVANSAAIGTSLIQEHFGDADDRTSSDRRTVVLMGHSMGSLTTLQMALRLSAQNPMIQLHLILVAPAVGFVKPRRCHNIETNPKLSSFLRTIRRPFTRVGTEIGRYCLKRLVGRRHFWRNGLRTVWGNPDKLSESDVLRFQWHSIIQGWEYGLFYFASAQTQSFDTISSEHELLDAALKAPNVKSIQVIVGSKDPIVKPERLETFFQNYPEIPIHVMNGLGHDPFEEDAESFMKAVQSMLPLQPKATT
jgi:pimeloyl-ACP methyl ester carboxylesterase